MQQTDRPRLRPGLRFVRQDEESGGGVSWVVKDPARQKYFRFGQVEAWLMQHMDGGRSLQQICDDLHDEVGLRATPKALDVLVRRLRELGLVERSVEERCAMLLERVRTERRLRRESDNTIVRMRFSFGDHDELIGRSVAAMPFFWTRGFVIASAIGFAAYFYIVVAYWAPFSETMALLINPLNMSVSLLLATYAIVTLVSIIHELGHGLTCKRFGGEVRELGAMMLYFMPAFYCNVSDAWTFEKRSHRLWVTFAGGWIELWVAVIAAGVWLVTEPGTLVNTIAAITSATAGALSVLMNYNPLLPFDGYYALVDWFGIPNLRARSFGYLGAVIKHHLLRMDVAVPTATERERRVFLTFAICAGLYTTTILSLIGFWAARFMVARFGWWGAFIFLLLLLRITRGPRAALMRTARAFAAEKLPRGARRRGLAGGAALLLVVVTFTAFAPWTSRADAHVVVEPAARTWLRPAQDALLVDVRVADGQRVTAGDTIAVLRSPDLDIAQLRLLAAAADAERRAGAASARGLAGPARAAQLEFASLQEQLRVLEHSRAELVLRAPFTGTVATPLLAERIGDRLAAGDSLVELWGDGDLRARIDAPPSEGMLPVGGRVRIRFAAHPSLTWTSRIERVDPVADGDRVTAFAPLGVNDDHQLRPGMIGRARVDVQRTTAAAALMLSMRRILRLDLLL
jgi:putative peptide zinc metalloprotease protein